MPEAIDPQQQVNRFIQPQNGPEGGSSAAFSSPAGRDAGAEGKSKAAGGRQQDTVQLSKEALEIQKLMSRDREVRAHEAAHATAGGPFTGAPTLSYERGPDGRSYATGGEVSIDFSPVAGDPEATLRKAERVRAAALAPADPSAQDRLVAAKATTLAAQARTKLAASRADEAEAETPLGAGDDGVRSPENSASDASPKTAVPQAGGFSRLDITV